MLNPITKEFFGKRQEDIGELPIFPAKQKTLHDFWFMKGVDSYFDVLIWSYPG